MAASAGIEAVGRGKGRGSGVEASVSGRSRNLNKGGWSLGKEEVNHMLLYIWMLNGDCRGWGSGEWEWLR
jgi:hypothetical protein